MRILPFRLAAVARNSRNPRRVAINTRRHIGYALVRRIVEPDWPGIKVSADLSYRYHFFFFQRLPLRQNCCLHEKRLPNHRSDHAHWVQTSRTASCKYDMYHDDNKSNHNQKCPLFVSNKVAGKLVPDYQS